MARLNITFASLDATNKTRPQSTAEGMTYTQGLVIEGSLSAGSDSGNVYKIVHTDPVADAALPDLMAWISENIPDYSNQLYEVYIPEIKTSNTALGPTGVANTVYSFTGTKQSDHSMIARATVTANGTDEYPVGTVLECIIKPDLTKTDWRVVNAVQGIIEVAISTSVASRNALMQTADAKANGRDNYTIIFDSVTFTNANESPTHSTTDVFWCEVIKTDDRIFIRTSAAINQGGVYFNRVYYSRMNLDTLAWSDWTPYNFQVLDLNLFAAGSNTFNVPTIYLNEVKAGNMIFKYNGEILNFDATLYFLHSDSYSFSFGTPTDSITPLTLQDFAVAPMHNVFISGTSGTLNVIQKAYVTANTARIVSNLYGAFEYLKTMGTSRYYVSKVDTSVRLLEVNVSTGAYTMYITDETRIRQGTSATATQIKIMSVDPTLCCAWDGIEGRLSHYNAMVSDNAYEGELRNCWVYTGVTSGDSATSCIFEIFHVNKTTGACARQYCTFTMVNG